MKIFLNLFVGYRILFFIGDMNEFLKKFNGTNEAEVYCRRGVKIEGDKTLLQLELGDDGRHFRAVYEALCVTRWKNDSPLLVSRYIIHNNLRLVKLQFTNVS